MLVEVCTLTETYATSDQAATLPATYCYSVAFVVMTTHPSAVIFWEASAPLFRFLQREHPILYCGLLVLVVPQSADASFSATRLEKSLFGRELMVVRPVIRSL